MSAYMKINSGGLHPAAQSLKDFLSKKLIGQQLAVDRITSSFNLALSPLKDPQTPIFVGLFLGGTGTGKTYAAELTAEFFCGNREGMTKILGPDYSEDHMVTSLSGSPNSYVGYNDPPILTQTNIDSHSQKYRMLAAYKKNPRVKELIDDMNRTIEFLNKKDQNTPEWQEFYHHYENLNASLEIQLNAMFNNKPNYSVILIDEFEKASRSLWNLLLEISSKGQLAIKGKHAGITSFKNSFVFLTSNLASGELASLAKGGPTSIGFSSNQSDTNSDWHIAIERLRREIPPELLNRIEENTVVFKQPSEEDLKKIMDLEFLEISELLWKRQRITLKASDELLNFIFKKSSQHPEFGGRQARKRIKKYIREKLANPLNVGEITPGDVILADINQTSGEIFFQKDMSYIAIPVFKIEEEEDDIPFNVISTPYMSRDED